MIQHLESLTLGSYMPHHALIHLSRDASPWNRENETNIPRISVFVHEYAHFLHNYSTVAGVYDLVAQLRLLRLFINTVNENGMSSGSDGFDEPTQRQLDATLNWRTNILGKLTACDKGSKNISPVGNIKIQKAFRGSEEIIFHNQKLEAHWGEVHFDVLAKSGNALRYTHRLGSQVMFEGIAWELERAFYRATSEPTEELDRRLPEFPYKIARSTFEKFSGITPSPNDMARLQMLCLLSSNSGDTLLALANFIKDEPSLSIQEVIVRTTDNAKEMIDAAMDLLRIESESFVDRGPVGKGIKRMVDWSIKFLLLRKENLFFEIELLEKGLDDESFTKLLDLCPPCPVIQKTEDGSEMLYLASQKLSEHEMAELGSAQGMMQFAASHFTTQKIVKTTSARRGTCKFFGVCGVSPHPNGPDICQQAPWLAFDYTQTKGCWYAVGVAHSRGLGSL